LEVSYSTDGVHWIDLLGVSPDNWQHLTMTLPITNWDDLSHLQIKIEGIPTSLNLVPKVYLDGMFVEVHYETSPIFGSLSNSASTPENPAGMGTPPIVNLPASQKPVPANRTQDTFKANESPEFNFDLGSLPQPSTSTPQTNDTAP